MSEWFKVEAKDIERIATAIQNFGAGAGQIVDEVMHGEAADVIKREIANILPSSGRHWRGKAAPASAVMPGGFSQDNESLGVTIAARNTYHYLYFPDDGSNTIHHAGNQQFMLHGAENAADEVADKVTEELIKRFEEA